MTFNKKQRIATVLVAGPIVWFLLWSLVGYFVGLRGVGVGWPAFWAVGGISLIVPAVIAVPAGFIGLSSYWIQKGEK